MEHPLPQPQATKWRQRLLMGPDTGKMLTGPVVGLFKTDYLPSPPPIISICASGVVETCGADKVLHIDHG